MIVLLCYIEEHDLVIQQMPLILYKSFLNWAIFHFCESNLKKTWEKIIIKCGLRLNSIVCSVSDSGLSICLFRSNLAHL